MVPRIRSTQRRTSSSLTTMAIFSVFPSLKIEGGAFEANAIAIDTYLGGEVSDSHQNLLPAQAQRGPDCERTCDALSPNCPRVPRIPSARLLRPVSTPCGYSFRSILDPVVQIISTGTVCTDLLPSVVRCPDILDQDVCDFPARSRLSRLTPTPPLRLIPDITPLPIPCLLLIATCTLFKEECREPFCIIEPVGGVVTLLSNAVRLSQRSRRSPVECVRPSL